MKKIEIKGSAPVEKAPEDILVDMLMGDRVIIRQIEVTPENKPQIIDPNTGKPHAGIKFDRWPLRASVVHASKAIIEEHRIHPGDTIFLEDGRAVGEIRINGEVLGMTRSSNILLKYKNK